MYKRFLNNNDYISIVTEEALSQLIRGNEERLAQAEEAAEMSVLEYLSDNYEVEAELAVGKRLGEYNPQITYPVGAHFYKDGKIWETMRSVSGCKAPAVKSYWERCVDDPVDQAGVKEYSQWNSYHSGDITRFSNVCWRCLECNGADLGDVRVPGIESWAEVVAYAWQANVPYHQWEVVEWIGRFYALIETEGVDLTINPYDSGHWGLIGEYDPTYSQYEFSSTEYVTLAGKVFAPTMNVNADELKEGCNIRRHDPRNGNLKKHILRMAVYELHKLISPNNVSSTRITDYETSILWLRDAARLKINPQIPRKMDEENKPVTEFAISTFQRDYDPYKNPWQI
jgi:hypothetical protein